MVEMNKPLKWSTKFQGNRKELGQVSSQTEYISGIYALLYIISGIKYDKTMIKNIYNSFALFHCNP